MYWKSICYFFILFFALPGAQAQQAMDPSLVKPRLRVIVDNDFSGDPDGLFQLAHLLLSPSVEVRGIIGSHLRPGDGFDPSTTQADDAAQTATALLKLMPLKNNIPVIAGSNTGMQNDSVPVKSAAVAFIVKEALRTDTRAPLYLLCGAGLTEIASAVLTKPEIATKLTLVWIGGPEYAELAFPPPNYSALEYNLAIDINAAKVIFNQAAIPLWQVPRNAYRQALVSYAELLAKVKGKGALGRFLTGKIEGVMQLIGKYGGNIGETYILGDSPLVLLTALQSSFEADPSSSTYTVRTAPKINDRGQYEYNASGRNIRVYDALDTRLLFDDFFAKLDLLQPGR